MFVGFHGPHEPYTMPKEYMDTYSPDEVLLPAEVNENTKNAKSQCYKNKVESLEKKFGPATDEKTRTGIAGYLNLMKIIDDCVGQLLEKLKEMDLLENTLVVFSSDHGEMLGEYGIFGKGATFHEAEVRIPLMMRFPDGKEAGTVRNGLVSTIDWNPTLYDYLDIKPDFGMPGKSVMPMVENNEAVRDHVLCGCQGLMIRNEKYKLWHNPGTQDGEMYDLENDPDEMNNLYNEESFSDLKSKLLKDMLEARMDDDRAIAQLTSKDRRLLEEVCASHEPQVIAWPKS